MSREKQIEEMSEIICDDRQKSVYSVEIAEHLYNAGYRKQSEGERISNELGGYKYAFYCSECGWVDGYLFNDRHKFCPNCGAKMKGGAE